MPLHIDYVQTDGEGFLDALEGDTVLRGASGERILMGAGEDSSAVAVYEKDHVRISQLQVGPSTSGGITPVLEVHGGLHITEQFQTRRLFLGPEDTEFDPEAEFQVAGDIQTTLRIGDRDPQGNLEGIQLLVHRDPTEQTITNEIKFANGEGIGSSLFSNPKAYAVSTRGRYPLSSLYEEEDVLVEVATITHLDRITARTAGYRQGDHTVAWVNEAGDVLQRTWDLSGTVVQDLVVTNVITGKGLTTRLGNVTITSPVDERSVVTWENRGICWGRIGLADSVQLASSVTNIHHAALQDSRVALMYQDVSNSTYWQPYDLSMKALDAQQTAIEDSLLGSFALRLGHAQRTQSTPTDEESLTFVLWFRTSSFSATPQTMISLTGGGVGERTIFMQIGKIGVTLDGHGTSLVGNSTNLDDGAWHHLVVSMQVLSSTIQVSIFVDGVFDKNGTLAKTNFSFPRALQFGNHGTWVWDIDDTRIYRMVVLQEVVAKEFMNGGNYYAATKGAYVPNLWEAWDMQRIEGDQLLGIHQNRHMTLTNRLLSLRLLGDVLSIQAEVAREPRHPHCAEMANGNLVLVYAQKDATNTTLDIYAQVLDPEGETQVPPFLVYTSFQNFVQQKPRVAVLRSGQHVVVWESQHPVDGWGIYASAMEGSGAILQSAVAMHGDTVGERWNPSIAALRTTPRFAVAWEQNDGTIQYRVLDRHFAEIQEVQNVSTGTYDEARKPVVFSLSHGGFAIVYFTRFNSEWNVHMRRFDKDGIPQDTSEFLVSTDADTAPDTSIPACALTLFQGDFLITWKGEVGDIFEYQLFARTGSATATTAAAAAWTDRPIQLFHTADYRNSPEEKISQFQLSMHAVEGAMISWVFTNSAGGGTGTPTSRLLGSHMNNLGAIDISSIEITNTGTFYEGITIAGARRSLVLWQTQGAGFEAQVVSGPDELLLTDTYSSVVRPSVRQAIRMNGEGQYGYVPWAPTSPNFSVALWHRTTTPFTEQPRTLFSFGDASESYGIGLTATQWVISLSSSQVYHFDLPNTIHDGLWHQVGLVINDTIGSVHLYYDGGLSLSWSRPPLSAIPWNLPSLFLGASHASGTGTEGDPIRVDMQRAYVGVLDQVVVWNTSVESTAIAHHFHYADPRFHATYGVHVDGWWTFDTIRNNHQFSDLSTAGKHGYFVDFAREWIPTQDPILVENGTGWEDPTATPITPVRMTTRMEGLHVLLWRLEQRTSGRRVLAWKHFDHTGTLLHAGSYLPPSVASTGSITEMDVAPLGDDREDAEVTDAPIYYSVAWIEEQTAGWWVRTARLVFSPETNGVLETLVYTLHEEPLISPATLSVRALPHSGVAVLWGGQVQLIDRDWRLLGTTFPFPTAMQHWTVHDIGAFHPGGIVLVGTTTNTTGTRLVQTAMCANAFDQNQMVYPQHTAWMYYREEEDHKKGIGRVGLVWDHFSGNVGIGTPLPTSSLDVRGSISVEGDMILRSQEGDTLIWSYDTYRQFIDTVGTSDMRLESLTTNLARFTETENVLTNADVSGVLRVTERIDASQVTIDTTLSVGQQVFLGDTLSVAGDTHIQGTLDALNAMIQHNLSVGGDAYVAGDTRIDGMLDVSQIILDSTLSVGGDTRMDGVLEVSQVTIDTTLSVGGDIRIDGLLDVSQVSIDTTLSVGDAVFLHTLSIAGDTYIQGILDVSALSVGGELYVARDTRIDGTVDVSALFVREGVFLQDTLSVAGTTSLEGLLEATTVTVDTTLSVGDTVYTETLSVAGNTYIQGLFDASRVIIDTTLSVGDSLFLGDTLSVGGDTRIDGLLEVSQSRIDTTLSVGGDTRIDGLLDVSQTKIDTTLSVGGDTRIDGHFEASQVTIDSTLSVGAAVTLAGDTRIDGVLSASQGIIDTTLSVGEGLYAEGVFAQGTSRFDGRLDVSRLFVSTTLSVGGDTFLRTALDVSQVVVRKSLFVGDALSVAGPTRLNNVVDVAKLNVGTTLSVGQNVFFAGSSLSVAGSTYIQGGLQAYQITVPTTVTAASVVAQDSLQVDGLMSALFATVDNTLTVGNLLAVSGNTQLDGTLQVLSPAEIESTLTVGENTYLRGGYNRVDGLLDASRVSIDTTLVIGENVYVGGALSITGNTFVEGLLDASRARIDTTLSVGEAAYFAGDTQIQATLSVSQAAYFGGNTRVDGILDVSQMTIDTSLSVGGSIFFGGHELYPLPDPAGRDPNTTGVYTLSVEPLTGTYQLTMTSDSGHRPINQYSKGDFIRLYGGERTGVPTWHLSGVYQFSKTFEWWISQGLYTLYNFGDDGPTPGANGTLTGFETVETFDISGNFDNAQIELTHFDVSANALIERGLYLTLGPNLTYFPNRDVVQERDCVYVRSYDPNSVLFARALVQDYETLYNDVTNPAFGFEIDVSHVELSHRDLHLEGSLVYLVDFLRNRKLGPSYAPGLPYRYYTPTGANERYQYYIDADGNLQIGNLLFPCIMYMKWHHRANEPTLAPCVYNPLLGWGEGSEPTLSAAIQKYDANGWLFDLYVATYKYIHSGDSTISNETFIESLIFSNVSAFLNDLQSRYDNLNLLTSLDLTSTMTTGNQVLNCIRFKL